MPKHRYRSGDTIVLKSRVLGSIQPQGSGRIMSALPEAQGLVRYRVRFEHENFDRSISQDDIDTTASSPRTREPQGASPRDGTSSWINPNAIRTRK
ncbi:cold-shock protein [Rhizobiaceae bacterium BDR2-2]|uniref:Cold-shock protein n=1 Tax=Ectorhizobium quercum TaxID=2965071 RepID=A0AAE3N3M4_9HYPH|nr:cold-shock protein [Ectorhizobium quercum]MCX8999611.1 cold-shock protein [Ectorhizobium quercum]